MLSVEPNDDTEKVLSELALFEDVLRNKVIRSSLVAFSKPLKKSMAANAPQDQGYLAQSINHKLLNARQKSRLSIAESDVALLVGPNKKVNGFSQARKANLVENGVQPHVISAKDKVLKVGGKGFASADINHPGVKADPFMANALEDNESNFSGLFYQGMKKSLDRIRAQ